jgi:hypothetical protein
MVFENVIGKRGVLDNSNTDPGKQFTSQFWDRVCSHISFNHRLSTAFHRQTDGQTERPNQTMEKFLRAFWNYKHDYWVELLPVAEFAFNNSIHHSTLMTHYLPNYNYHPIMQFKPPKDPSFRLQVQAASWMAGVEETHRIVLENIIKDQERQTK